MAATNNGALFIKDLLLGSILGCIHCLVVSILNMHVSEPYMDEEFHIAQTQLYCRGIYTQWNPMITTPPALYLLASILGFCEGRERFLNSLLVPLCFAGLCRLRRHFLLNFGETNMAKEDKAKNPADELRDVSLPALAIISLPVLFDTSLLFYTDMLSLTAVVWGMGTNCPFHSFLAFTIALFTRQTNIVWAALYCFPYVTSTLRHVLNGQLGFRSAILQVLRRCCLHLLLGVCFLLFLVWNRGSLVLGDKSAHRPALHLPQLLYFFAFSGISALPLFIGHFQKIKLIRFPYSHSLMLFVGFSIIAWSSVKCCTMAHPYLLADNRHFTFYIWQRIFQRHWIIKYALVPVYAICGTLMLEMAIFMSTLDKFAFICATALCLVPALLLEFRYFIIPYTIWRCSLAKQQYRWASAEVVMHLIVNGIALYLFMGRPFVWTFQPDKWQRFMW